MGKCEKCGFEYFGEENSLHFCVSNNLNVPALIVDPSWNYTINILDYPSKIRGFEKISREQWDKDYYPHTIPQVKTFLVYDEVKLPKRATSRSAGYDVFSPFGFILEPNESIKIPTGFKAYMMDDEKLVFHPRSGLGFKYFIRLANTTGVGDSDFFNNPGNEGHYWVKIRNEGNETLKIECGEAIAQCIFEKYLLADGDSFIDGKPRIGGFGSTDIK